MKTIVLFLTILLTGATSAFARAVVQPSYETMSKLADTILIVSVAKPSERTGAQETFHTQIFDQVRTVFKVQAVLRGKYDSKTWEFQHLAYPLSGRVGGGNGWGFVWFEKMEETLMVFLKADNAGHLVPITGQEDPDMAFTTLPPISGVQLHQAPQGTNGVSQSH